MNNYSTKSIIIPLIRVFGFNVSPTVFKQIAGNCQLTQFTLGSNSILETNSTVLMSLLPTAKKMFPSQRRAMFDKLSKTSIDAFVSKATKFGVGDVMIQFLPTKRFKESFQKNRKKWDELFSEQLNNVKQFPDDIVSSVYSFYSSNSNSNYLLQIRKLHMVLFKLEMIQANNKLFYTVTTDVHLKLSLKYTCVISQLLIVRLYDEQ
jgi:hypothetical protein